MPGVAMLETWCSCAEGRLRCIGNELALHCLLNRPCGLHRFDYGGCPDTRGACVRPARSHACFICEQCGHEELVHNDSGRIEEPKRCGNPACQATWSLKMVHNRSLFINKQIVKMQVRARSAARSSA